MPILTLYEDYAREQVHDIFEPERPFTPQTGTWGLRGIVKAPGRPRDFVFFVTFGHVEAHHEFDEWVTEEGVLSWQSEPMQILDNPTVRQLIEHDELSNSIYLLLRTKPRETPYTYLGRLKYLGHDSERQRPVYFQWQILDWDRSRVPRKRMGLALVRSGVVVEGLSRPSYGVLAVMPPPEPTAGEGIRSRAFRSRKGIDYSGNDARNREIGRAGECLVLQHERKALSSLGRQDLADRVRHISKDEGDGAGYDIKSFTSAGETKYIEVKTTRTGPRTQFYLSSNEVEFSRTHPETYHLYRVYGLDPRTSSGQFFILSGDVSTVLTLTPTEYRAALSG